MPSQEKTLKKKLILTGRQLYGLRLVAGKTGNLSVRLSNKYILITATGSCLGRLKDRDIIKVSLSTEIKQKVKSVSSEFPVHRLIYRNLDIATIIHCHPPLTNAYFSIYSHLRARTPEIKYYLGDIEVVKQNTLTITKLKPIIRALEKSNLAVIKNHGVICVAQSFKESLILIEILEEAIKTAAIARLFRKEKLNDLDKELKRRLVL